MHYRDRYPYDDDRLDGYYARDEWREGLGGDYARDNGVGHEYYGGFRGRGPKNWKRSDERIAEDVHEILTEDHYVDATDIVVNVVDGHVTLSGTVDDRRQKRRAEDIVLSISGVVDVMNTLKLQHRHDDRPQTIGKASE